VCRRLTCPNNRLRHVCHGTNSRPGVKHLKGMMFLVVPPCHATIGNATGGLVSVALVDDQGWHADRGQNIADIDFADHPHFRGSPTRLVLVPFCAFVAASLQTKRLARWSKRLCPLRPNFNVGDHRKRGLDLPHIALARMSSSKVVDRNLLRPLRVAARALLRALQDSRERAARQIIRDYSQVSGPRGQSMPRRATVRNRFWPDAISRHAPDRIWIRTAAARDVESLADYFAQLTQSSRHNRFMSSLAAELREQPRDAIIAEASYAFDRQRKCGEFAMSVADRWQHHGLWSAFKLRTITAFAFD
jgi:hypothetical protein